MAEEAKHVAPSASSIPEMPPLTRREFLNYAWLASLGFVFVAGFGGATILFSMPRFKKGEFGGEFPLGKLSDKLLPEPNDPPKPNSDGKFWLVNVNGSILALYNVCVHLGCLYQWQPVTGRFECPCHGSKYQKNGTYIEGPAPRSLDRMVISFRSPDDKIVVQSDSKANPVPIPSDQTLELVVDTGKIIQGEPHG